MRLCTVEVLEVPWWRRAAAAGTAEGTAGARAEAVTIEAGRESTSGGEVKGWEWDSRLGEGGFGEGWEVWRTGLSIGGLRGGGGGSGSGGLSGFEEWEETHFGSEWWGRGEEVGDGVWG